MVLVQGMHSRHQFSIAAGQQRWKHVFLLLGMVLARGPGEKGFDGPGLALGFGIHARGFHLPHQCCQLSQMHLHLLVAGIQRNKAEGFREGAHG